MTADPRPDPDPLTDANNDATDRGVSATKPAEGEDSDPPGDSGSPQG